MNARRRRVLVAGAGVAAAALSGRLARAAASTEPSDEAAWSALQAGGVLIMRHAQTEPGVGDPPGFRLDDCATQRNLSPAGRAQAAAVGPALAKRGVRVDRIESSAWCRCMDTARLAFPGAPVHVNAALNSFFEDRRTGPAQTQALRARLLAWRGPGVLVLVTHQVNIGALTGRPVAVGEGVVLRTAGNEIQVVGAVQF
jgi:phosphohistidine phosphatase SixA